MALTVLCLSFVLFLILGVPVAFAIGLSCLATFAVEGYTDSLGPPDYNLELSQRRADSVKRYLVEVIGINPAQINAHGYGATRFLVTPRPVIFPSNSPEEQMEIERQKPNRRVVIVVHTDER